MSWGPRTLSSALQLRALQLADDLALIARSESDLNKLLQQWSHFCRRNHKETSIKKTEVVIYTVETDGSLSFANGVFQVDAESPLKFAYNSVTLTCSELFIYLGVLFDSRGGPECAWKHRDEKGTKAFGALCGLLRWVPFLPFARTAELGESLVGGAYLYSSDLWATYIDQRHKGVGRNFASWLLGFGRRVRSERVAGWIPFRDLDLKGEASVVRMLADGLRVGGLLTRALRQLHQNWVHAPALERKHTWLGRALKMIRKVWPRFTLESCNVNGLKFSGLPQDYKGSCPHVAYFADASSLVWKRRQNQVLRAPPSIHKQDYPLHALLKMACSPADLQQLAQPRREMVAPLSETIFTVLPSADTEAVRVMLRTLAGMEDFARVNAHHDRRAVFPDLSLACFKHCCLYCLVNLGQSVVDSEWHAVCECPSVSAARTRFQTRTDIDVTTVHVCTVDDLSRVVFRVNHDNKLSGAFSHFMYDIRATRRHVFRKLSSNGPHGRSHVAAQLAPLRTV